MVTLVIMENTVSASENHGYIVQCNRISTATDLNNNRFGLFLFILLFDVSFFFNRLIVIQYSTGHR